MSDNAKIENNFSYHAPSETQKVTYEWLRAAFKNVAYDIEFSCPESREKSVSITHLEEAMFWANAAIARNPAPAKKEEEEIFIPPEWGPSPILPLIGKILRGEGNGGS